MKYRYKFVFVLFVLLGGLIYVLFGNKINDAYQVEEYFPLNNDDVYVYSQHEGPESGEVIVRVENVRKTVQGKEFDFVWSGQYNDRVMSLLLNSRGISFRENSIPSKVKRTFSPGFPVMIPGTLQKNAHYGDVIERVEDANGNLLKVEKRETGISFVGVEKIKVPAGTFQCLHFFTAVTNKDAEGNSDYRHTYDFWVAKHIGVVKQVHCFTRFKDFRYIKPEEKVLKNRYQDSFVEILELKHASIAS